MKEWKTAAAASETATNGSVKPKAPPPLRLHPHPLLQIRSPVIISWRQIVKVTLMLRGKHSERNQEDLFELPQWFAWFHGWTKYSPPHQSRCCDPKQLHVAVLRTSPE